MVKAWLSGRRGARETAVGPSMSAVSRSRSVLARRVGEPGFAGIRGSPVGRHNEHCAARHSDAGVPLESPGRSGSKTRRGRRIHRC